MTDSETRVYLSGLPYGHQEGRPGQSFSNYFATLSIGHQSYGISIYNQGGSPEGLFLVFDDALQGQHGEWTLDLRQTIMTFTNQRPGLQSSQGGHWVIHFQVP